MKSQYPIAFAIFIAKFLAANLYMIWVPMTPFFLPLFALSLERYASLLVLRRLMGLSTVFFGHLLEHLDSRLCVILSVILQALNPILLYFSTSHVSFLLSHVFGGLGMALLTASSQILFSEIASKQDQAQITATTELSWGLASFLGVPALVWLADTYMGWTDTFCILALCHLLPLLILLFFPLPTPHPSSPKYTSSSSRVNYYSGPTATEDEAEVTQRLLPTPFSIALNNSGLGEVDQPAGSDSSYEGEEYCRDLREEEQDHYFFDHNENGAKVKINKKDDEKLGGLNENQSGAERNSKADWTVKELWRDSNAW